MFEVLLDCGDPTDASFVEYLQKNKITIKTSIVGHNYVQVVFVGKYWALVNLIRDNFSTGDDLTDEGFVSLIRNQEIARRFGTE